MASPSVFCEMAIVRKYPIPSARPASPKTIAVSGRPMFAVLPWMAAGRYVCSGRPDNRKTIVANTRATAITRAADSAISPTTSGAMSVCVRVAKIRQGVPIFSTSAPIVSVSKRSRIRDHRNPSATIRRTGAICARITRNTARGLLREVGKGGHSGRSQFAIRSITRQTAAASRCPSPCALAA